MSVINSDLSVSQKGRSVAFVRGKYSEWCVEGSELYAVSREWGFLTVRSRSAMLANDAATTPELLVAPALRA